MSSGNPRQEAYDAATLSLAKLNETLGDDVLVATSDDNPQLLEFASNAEMGAGGLQLQYDRSPDYFRYLSCQGGSPTALCFTPDGVIDGVGSMSTRTAFIDGEPHPIAYWTDLRIRRKPSVTRLWRKVFLESIAICRQDYGIRYHPMAILEDNTTALKALTKSVGASVAADVVYRYQIAQVLAPLPFRKRARVPGDLRLVRGNELPEAEIVRFLDSVERRKVFGYTFASSEWQHRKSTWAGLELAEFRVWVDGQDRIVATCCPWDPSFAREVIIRNLPAKLQALAAVGGLLGRPSGLAAVKTDRPFRPLYLTHLAFSDDLPAGVGKELLRAMVEDIFAKTVRANRGRFSCLSFMDAYDGRLMAALGGFVTQSTPAQLVSLRHREERPLAEVQNVNNFSLPVGMEIALA